MERRANGTGLARPAGGAALVARRALEIVVGVLLADRELASTSTYDDLFHMPW